MVFDSRVGGANFHPVHPVKTPSFALARRPGAQINRGNDPSSVAALRPSSVSLRRAKRVEGSDGGRGLDSKTEGAESGSVGAMRASFF